MEWILSPDIFANTTMCSLHIPFSCRISTSTPRTAPSVNEDTSDHCTSNSAASWGMQWPRIDTAHLCDQSGFSALPSLAVPSSYSDASQKRDFFSRAIFKAYKICPDQGAWSIAGKKYIICFCKSAKHAHKGHLWTSFKSQIREESKTKLKEKKVL